MNDKILNYLVKKEVFDSDTYSYLVDTYGYEELSNAIMPILRSKNNNDIYKLVINTSSYMVANNLLLVRLNEIIRELVQIFNIYNLEEHSTIDDNIRKISNVCEDKKTLKEVNNLYKEYVLLRNRICECNISLVDYTIRLLGINKESEMYNEMYQEGFFGLLRACEKYDSDRSAFVTFAVISIKSRIISHLHDLDLCIYLPYGKKIKYYVFLKVYQSLQESLHRIPNNIEIMNEVNNRLSDKSKITLEDINLFISIYNSTSKNVSIYDNVRTDDDYVLREETLPSSSVKMEDEVMQCASNILNSDLLKGLNDRQKMLIYYRYLCDNPLSFTEIGKKIGISKQAVSVMHQKILVKIRENTRSL